MKINKRTKPVAYIGFAVIFIAALVALIITVVSQVNKEKKPLPDEIQLSEAIKERESKKEKESESVSEIISSETSKEDTETEISSGEENSTEKVNLNSNGKTPFENHGAISVSGTTLVDANGDIFRLCGVSTHGIGWFPEYVNKDSFQNLRDDFGANVVRLAMYTGEGGGYCSDGNKDDLKKLVKDGVDYATELGMYVIVDWHILSDSNPNTNKEEAKKFFDEISGQYKNQDNIVYEICNEPNGGISWEEIKKYAEEVIPVIRNNDSNAIIVVGTPTWSQEVDKAADNPITDYDNIMYTLHFYADTHKSDLRKKASYAIEKGLPLFVTEFGICDASGNGSNNIDEGNTWIAFLDKNNISFVGWNLSNKNESSAFISPGCVKTSGWTYNDLSQSGQWLVSTLDTHTDNGSSFFKDGKVVPVDTSKTNPTDDSPAGSSDSAGGGNNQSIVTVASGEGDGLKVTINRTNSWKEGGKLCVQYNCVITNNSTSKISNWSFDIDWGEAFTTNQIWCAKNSDSGTKMTVSPESYNSSIDSGKSYTDMGFIIKCDSEPKDIKISF